MSHLLSTEGRDFLAEEDGLIPKTLHNSTTLLTRWLTIGIEGISTSYWIAASSFTVLL
jgi:hypothetical protein